MNRKVTKRIKSREEILSTLSKVSVIGDATIGVLKDNSAIGAVSVTDWLLTLCGRTLELIVTDTDSHEYNYKYFDFPEDGDDRTEIPVVYFMDSWVEDPMSDDGLLDDEELEELKPIM